MRPLAPTGRATALALAGLLLAVSGCGPPNTIRPNLVLITADGMRPDWLACYGSAARDFGRDFGEEACALGERGALYELAFATAPSGAPSAASLLTSTYVSQHGVVDAPSTFLPTLGPPTLAGVLRDGGYATAAFVDSPELNRSRHLDRGFDRYEDPRRIADDPVGVAVGLRARSWAATARAPWFVWVHFGEAHGPFGTDRPAVFRAAYGEALRRIDRQLSQLVAVLDSSQSPPGILFAGLHGQGLGEADAPLGHGHALVPAAIHVPLLWRSPRAGAGSGVGRRISRPVSLIDVAPTLVEAAGLRAPASFEGIPLPHSDAGAADRSPRVLFAEHPGAIAVVRGNELGVFPLADVPAPGARPALRVRAGVFRLDAGSAHARRDADAREASGLPPLDAAVASLPTRWRADEEATPQTAAPE